MLAHRRQKIGQVIGTFNGATLTTNTVNDFIRSIKMNLIPVPVMLILCLVTAQAAYQGPVPPPPSGYGAAGSCTVATVSFPSPFWQEQQVDLFYPKNVVLPVPAIFFSHGYGGTKSVYYQEMMTHLATRGYGAVFSPYKTLGATHEERYNMLFEGFKEAIHRYPHIIDSTRVGFAGHSFGGGATPAMAYRGFVEHGWGANGKCMILMAPWYVLEITQEKLTAFPRDVKLIVQLYDDDVINDHRMGIDLFVNIGIPDANKDCVFLFSDTVQGYVYTADHSVCAQNTSNGVYDAYDIYGVFRLLDALADYAFTGDATAGRVALGNGAPEQTVMGPFKPLFVTDKPAAAYPGNKYSMACDNLQNPRRNYCSGGTAVAGNAGLPTGEQYPQFYSIPSPGTGLTEINFTLAATSRVVMEIIDVTGQKKAAILDQTIGPGAYTVTWDGMDGTGARLASGVYFCRLRTGYTIQIMRIIK